jgi:hypothetical protein
VYLLLMDVREVDGIGLCRDAVPSPALSIR